MEEAAVGGGGESLLVAEEWLALDLVRSKCIMKQIL